MGCLKYFIVIFIRKLLSFIYQNICSYFAKSHHADYFLRYSFCVLWFVVLVSSSLLHNRYLINNISRSTRTGKTDKSTRSFKIGLYYHSPVKNSKIKISMVAFWDKMLSAKDISSIYNAGDYFVDTIQLLKISIHATHNDSIFWGGGDWGNVHVSCHIIHRKQKISKELIRRTCMYRYINIAPTAIDKLRRH